MVSRLRPRLRSGAIALAAVALAAAAGGTVAYVQETAEARLESVAMLTTLQLELQRQEIEAQDGIHAGSHRAGGSARSRARTRPLLRELGEDDAAPIERRLAAFQRAVDRQRSAQARHDHVAAVGIHEREVEPAFARADTLLRRTFEAHRRDADRRQRHADVQTAITLFAALAVALLGLWRFRVARSRLVRAERCTGSSARRAATYRSTPSPGAAPR